MHPRLALNRHPSRVQLAAWWTLPLVLTACSHLAEDPHDSAPQTPEHLVLRCANWAKIDHNPYRVENNTWGKGSTTGWRQCVGLGQSTNNAATARFTWDWPVSSRGVKAFPEIIYGKKPGSPSTTHALPLPLAALNRLEVEYTAHVAFEGVGNVAFDFWLTPDRFPKKFDKPSISHEVMVWLSSHGGATPTGMAMGSTDIDGITYDIYLSKDHGAGWQYIAFSPRKSLMGHHTINVLGFLNYLQRTGHITGSEHLSSIELGSEVESGRGVLDIEFFHVLQPSD